MAAASDPVVILSAARTPLGPATRTSRRAIAHQNSLPMS
jgi:hypothetical protein